MLNVVGTEAMCHSAQEASMIPTPADSCFNLWPRKPLLVKYCSHDCIVPYYKKPHPRALAVINVQTVTVTVTALSLLCCAMLCFIHLCLSIILYDFIYLKRVV